MSCHKVRTSYSECVRLFRQGRQNRTDCNFDFLGSSLTDADIVLLLQVCLNVSGEYVSAVRMLS